MFQKNFQDFQVHNYQISPNLEFAGMTTVSSICNGLSLWGFGYVPIGSLDSKLLQEKPCCFMGTVSVLSSSNPETQSSFSCVCTDFSECFSDQPSSECSRQIEERVACNFSITFSITSVTKKTDKHKH